MKDERIASLTAGSRDKTLQLEICKIFMGYQDKIREIFLIDRLSLWSEIVKAVDVPRFHQIDSIDINDHRSGNGIRRAIGLPPFGKMAD